MHGDQGALFIVVVMLIAAIAAIAMSLISGRQRLAEIKAKGGSDEDGAGRIEQLTEENAALRGKVVRLEGRLATLERIVTDPAERTAREIESLR
jgi:hypothetical protein